MRENMESHNEQKSSRFFIQVGMFFFSCRDFSIQVEILSQVENFLTTTNQPLSDQVKSLPEAL